jgi:DNA-binding MurR/RpiR family transcriptional regulator
VSVSDGRVVIEDVEAHRGSTDLTLGPTSFLRRLDASAARLSSNDAAVAAYLRRNPLAGALSTADQLAHGAGVSKAAVVRFAVRLGYPGFTELREHLRQQLIQQQAESPPVVGDEGIDDVRIFLSTKLASDLASLSSFVESVNQRDLQRCAELLVQRDATVFVAGHRRGFAAAMFAQRMFNWVRPGVRLWRMEEPGLALALDEIRAGDVVLAFAFRRYPRVTGVLLEYAREVGAFSILVTESLTCPFVALADSVLLCPSVESAAFDSNVPAVFCIETLAGLMIKLVGAQVEVRIRQLHDSRHASRIEDAEVAGESGLPARAQAVARGRRRGAR